MNCVRRSAWILSAVLAAPAALGQSRVPDPMPLTVTPAVVEIGTFYDGAPVEVRGEARIGARVIVVARGPATDEVYNRKRRYGPIWISSGKVQISGAPSLFLRYSSDRLESWITGESLRENMLDERAVRDAVRLDPPDPVAGDRIRADFAVMKIQQGLYRFSDEGVLIVEYGGKRAAFTVTIGWPKKAPPGRYEVIAYEVLGGAVTRRASVELKVVEVGFPAMVAGLAANRAPVYGALAILAAVLAGFGIDFLATLLFGRRRVSH